MKRNKANQCNSGNARQSPVHLEFTHPTAMKVCVAGTFNEWRPEATFMVSVGGGRWLKELTLPPGVYEYRIVADGEWLPDPLARESRPNPFGGFNSILKVDGNGKPNGK